MEHLGYSDWYDEQDIDEYILVFLSANANWFVEFMWEGMFLDNKPLSMKEFISLLEDESTPWGREFYLFLSHQHEIYLSSHLDNERNED